MKKGSKISEESKQKMREFVCFYGIPHEWKLEEYIGGNNNISKYKCHGCGVYTLLKYKAKPLYSLFLEKLNLRDE